MKQMTTLNMSRYGRIVRVAYNLQLSKSLTSSALKHKHYNSNNPELLFSAKPDQIRVFSNLQLRTMSSFGTMKQQPFSETLVSVFSTLTRDLGPSVISKCILSSFGWFFRKYEKVKIQVWKFKFQGCMDVGGGYNPDSKDWNNSMLKTK